MRQNSSQFRSKYLLVNMVVFLFGFGHLKTGNLYRSKRHKVKRHVNIKEAETILRDNFTCSAIFK